MTPRLRSLLGRRRRRSEPEQLTCCRECGSTMVVPVASEDLGHAWYLRLRCGECARRRLVLLDEDRLRRYGQELDRLEDQLVSSMAPLRRDAGDQDAAALAEAVYAELIEPVERTR